VCTQALKGQHIRQKIRNGGRSSSQRGFTKDWGLLGMLRLAVWKYFTSSIIAKKLNLQSEVTERIYNSNSPQILHSEYQELQVTGVIYRACRMQHLKI